VRTCPCPCPCCRSVSAPHSCSDVTCVCVISSMAALSFSSWLQATHTNIAYRLGKPKNVNPMKMDAAACGRDVLVIVILWVVSVGAHFYKNICYLSELNVLFCNIFGLFHFPFLLLLTKQVIDVFLSLGCNMFPCWQ
jgi:hypothetical protein